MPPVEKTLMPAASARASEAETVVAPYGHAAATATPRSRSAALRRRPADAVVLLGVDAHAGDAVEHGRDRGDRAARPDGGDAALERLAVGRLGQAEGREDGRLEGDDGRAGGQGVGHLGVHEWGERHAGILPGRPAAAGRPSSGLRRS